MDIATVQLLKDNAQRNNRYVTELKDHSGLPAAAGSLAVEASTPDKAVLRAYLQKELHGNDNKR
jgi:hypothetical protein